MSSGSRSGEPPPASLVFLPIELHEHILSFLTFDTLFLASKALPLWHTIFTTRFLTSIQYTPPLGYNIQGAHQIFYGINSDFICLAQDGIIQKIYLYYDSGTRLDITEDPILNTPFFRSIEDRDVIYPCIPVTFHPTRLRRTRKKPDPYVIPSDVKGGRSRKIAPTIYHLDEIPPEYTLAKVAAVLVRSHHNEIPRHIFQGKYQVEIGPRVLNIGRLRPYRQGLEALFRGLEM
ncbi:hypothetical protein TWF718_006510 [Orbilia javanica]|uniref:F-box domain-containing protein n=1 Tax=Orbilia javanica TaxID=47235 RepID=A0AAN8MR87_9PEZI